MALKIIGAGFGRTGTASVKIALEQVGFDPCYHMSEVLESPHFTQHWIQAAEGSPNWDQIFDGYQAAVDFPRTNSRSETVSLLEAIIAAGPCAALNEKAASLIQEMKEE